MQLSAEKIWNSAQEQLRSRLGRDTHNMWFAPLRVCALVRKQCLMPGVDAKDTVSWLATLRDTSVVCVGHMPHLSQLARLLLKPRSSTDRPVEFKKASACCIFFEKGVAGGRRERSNGIFRKSSLAGS